MYFNYHRVKFIAQKRRAYAKATMQNTGLNECP